MKKTTYKDLFDFSDNKEIKKAIKDIRTLNEEYERLIANVANSATESLNYGRFTLIFKKNKKKERSN